MKSFRRVKRSRRGRHCGALLEGMEPRILLSFVINPTGNDAYAHADADGPTGGYVYANPAHEHDSLAGTTSATADANATYQATADQIVVHADASETKVNDAHGNSLADSTVRLAFTMTTAGTISLNGTLAGMGDGNLSQMGVLDSGNGRLAFDSSDAPHALPTTLNLPAGNYTIVVAANVNGNSVDGSIVNSSANSSADLTITLGAATTKPPHITSASAVTFQVGKPSLFMVTTTGDPTPGITETAILPHGITFVDNGNGTGTLSGTPDALDAPGHYHLIFTASNGVALDATHPAANQFFTLTLSGAGIKLPLAATHLVFARQPVSTSAGATLAPVTVLIEDKTGHVVTTDNSTVSLTLAGTAGGVLHGMTAVNAVSGTATFSNLSLTKAGAFALSAADTPLRPARSRIFKISPDSGTAHLVLSPSPIGTLPAGKPLPPISVMLEDEFGNVIKNNRTAVTLSIADRPAGGTLTGRATVPLGGGVAAFHNIRLLPAGSYTLELSDSALPGNGSLPLSLAIDLK